MYSQTFTCAKKLHDGYSQLHVLNGTIPACDGQTDEQTDGHTTTAYITPV